MRRQELRTRRRPLIEEAYAPIRGNRFVRSRKITTREVSRPRIKRVHAWQPVVPVRQLHGDGNLARIQVSIGSERSRVEVRERLDILFQYRGKPRSRRPVRNRLGIQARAGLVPALLSLPFVEST